MSENQLFNKESVHNKLLEKRGLLEQLQVPLPVISFIRKNSLLLQAGAAGLLLLIFAWNGYQYYDARQVERSTALLAAALKETSDDSRSRGLELVLREYPRTQAGLWSRLELAHLDFKAVRYQKAIEQYKLVLDALGANNSLAPLVLYSMSMAYEADGKSGEAVNYLEKLANVTGFSDPANLAMARIHEKRGDVAKAKESYGKVTGKTYQEKVKESLARLGTVTAPPAR
ncbi:MAG: hypothetical protein A2511_10655 [Deltaproteobacteria bacterium RIFOXYD12_FULL_50_9]|nr:MAG: hypothetical protein A2511_10655 [Deltaproteobacteria bacterium RIFOXYD12_FULL_50_9]